MHRTLTMMISGVLRVIHRGMDSFLVLDKNAFSICSHRFFPSEPPLHPSASLVQVHAVILNLTFIIGIISAFIGMGGGKKPSYVTFILTLPVHQHIFIRTYQNRKLYINIGFTHRFYTCGEGDPIVLSEMALFLLAPLVVSTILTCLGRITQPTVYILYTVFSIVMLY